MQDIAREYGAAQEAEKALRAVSSYVIRFEGFRHFEEIDWRSSALQKEQLEQELGTDGRIRPLAYSEGTARHVGGRNAADRRQPF